jgi:hypothetical protein
VAAPSLAMTIFWGFEALSSDLPLFRLEPAGQANSRLVSAFNVGPSATVDGGSKTPPYFGISISRHKISAAKIRSY